MVLHRFTRLISRKRFFHRSALHTWTKFSPTTFTTTTVTTPLVSIDVTAVKKLRSLHTSHPGKFLRILVEGGGCHGYQYVYKLDDTFDEQGDIGIVSAVEEESYEGALPPISPLNTMPVVVDRMSLDLLQDARLIYQQDVMGEQFAIVDNPIADKGCGCGVSFGIKEGVQV